MIFDKRVLFCIKAIGLYWVLYLIIFFVFGGFITEVINFFIIFPSSLYLDDVVKFILRFIGFSEEVPSDLNIFFKWKLVRMILYSIFYSIHIFIISFLLSFLIFSDKTVEKNSDF